ncbi:MAG TPA: MliC family protein [Sphingomonas sp.]|jgi:membrane-bound inhibitor of C-type lysozyme|uniref:MliC family protein n=1 Tax=Sphingomonas sp. TaxID=28214 RepID=UPI002ED89543
MKPALPPIFLLALLLAGCGGDGVTTASNMVDGVTPTAASDAGQGARLLCADGRQVRAVFLDPDTLALHIGAETIAMRSAPASKGARYIGPGWEWWTHGLQQATLTRLNAATTAPEKGVSCKVR